MDDITRNYSSGPGDPEPDRVGASASKGDARAEDYLQQTVRTMARGGQLPGDEILAIDLERAGLFRVTLRRLDEQGWPLPEFLVTTFSFYQCVIDAQVTPPKGPLLQLFVRYVDAAAQLFFENGTVVDRDSLRAQNVSIRRQARFAAVVDAVMRLPRAARLLVCGYVRGAKTTLQIANSNGVAELEVRRRIAAVFQESRRNVPAWLAAFEAADRARGIGGGDKDKRRDKKKKRREDK